MEPSEMPCKEVDLKPPSPHDLLQMLALRGGQGPEGRAPVPGSTLLQGPESGLSPGGLPAIPCTYFIGATGFPCRDLLCSGVM